MFAAVREGNAWANETLLFRSTHDSFGDARVRDGVRSMRSWDKIVDDGSREKQTNERAGLRLQLRRPFVGVSSGACPGLVMRNT